VRVFVVNVFDALETVLRIPTGAAPLNRIRIRHRVERIAAVKKFYREPGGWIRLQPANPAMAPLRVNERDIMVQGIVVGVIRKC
jgi:hypothetical protein